MTTRCDHQAELPERIPQQSRHATLLRIGLDLSVRITFLGPVITAGDNGKRQRSYRLGEAIVQVSDPCKFGRKFLDARRFEERPIEKSGSLQRLQQNVECDAWVSLTERALAHVNHLIMILRPVADIQGAPEFYRQAIRQGVRV